MGSRPLFILFLGLFIQVIPGYSTTLHSISRREGLSNGAVNSIARDAEGYFWLGTWNGLNRYDGHMIETFLPGSGPGGIHNHVIREIYPTAAGDIWMLTNKGIAHYDNVSGRFSSFFTDEPEQINYENDIALACSIESGVIASVFGRGLFRFDTREKRFIPFRFINGSAELARQVKRIHLSGGRLYCITASGKLLRLDGSDLVPLMTLPLVGAMSSSSIQSMSGVACLFITQRAEAALVVELEKMEVTRLKLQDDVITSLTVSRESGMLWTGTERGKIYNYSMNSGTFTETGGFSEQHAGNPIATRILCIVETEPDILWIGTDGNGAFTLRLTEFPVSNLPSTRLSYPIVRCILITKSKNMLVGTKGGGIDIFDPQGRHLRQISVRNGLSNNSVLSFLERSDGSILVGTDGSGIDILSGDYQQVRNFPRDFNKGSLPVFSSVYRILEDSDGHIFLGTSGFGVIHMETDSRGMPSGCSQLFLDPNVEQGRQKQIVYALAEEKPGIIWIGTRGFGVYRYNTINRRVITQYSSSSHPGLIPNDDILSILTDQRKLVWIGSSGGLFCLEPLPGNLMKVAGQKVQGDLAGTSIHSIRQDQAGNLWVSTNQGLSMIDASLKNVQSFNSSDGLINIEYSDGASYFDSSTGRLMVGGTMGIDVIQTDGIRFSSYFPPIAINRLLINNQPAEPGEESVLQSRINLQQDLVLRYNQNSIAFIISPLAYSGRERYRISYRLLNFMDEWVVNPADQPVAFTSLQAGDYILQLRVSDENGIWSEVTREVRITVKLPFWLTTWAIIGYIVIFLLIQFLLFNAYRRRVARRKEVAFQEMKKKQEEELQSYKIEFFTNVAHEFRTPLTLITSYIHALIEDKKLTTENPRLLKVYNNSLKLQKLVLEIMQFRKLEKGKEPLQIQVVDPCLLVREVVSDLELLASKRNICCLVEGCEEPIAFRTDADKFQQIFTNLISNAIKYNIEGGEVLVRIRKNEQQLTVEVEDTGLGIKPELLPKVFEPFGISSAKKRGSFPGYRSTGLGLAVTKGLTELLKGTISLESEPGRGTRFICTFPDIHEVNTDGVSAEAEEPGADTGFIEGVERLPAMPAETNTEARPRLLMVDDDPEILSMLKDFLQGYYSLTFAENGEEAYRKILSDKPDLVVSDVMMPGMDGIELCCKLRDNFDTSHLPLILLTARAEIEDRIAGLKAGADSYIPKPFHPEHLKVRIEKLLEVRQNIRNHFAGKEESKHSVKEIPDPFFQKLLTYIDENIDDENLSAEQLCDRLAISRSSLYDKTRSVLGTTPHGLINHRRLSKAATLLVSTQLTVSEIIDQTGFVSRTHFYDLFNKAYNCAPSEFRSRGVRN